MGIVGFSEKSVYLYQALRSQIADDYCFVQLPHRESRISPRAVQLGTIFVKITLLCILFVRL